MSTAKHCLQFHEFRKLAAGDISNPPGTLLFADCSIVGILSGCVKGVEPRLCREVLGLEDLFELRTVSSQLIHFRSLHWFHLAYQTWAVQTNGISIIFDYYF